ncbi:MAG: hypothetical protein U5K27_01930 [Desulfotignum sp.]|nr:hypothetical protein [Desulfotignum sp.]
MVAFRARRFGLGGYAGDDSGDFVDLFCGLAQSSVPVLDVNRARSTALTVISRVLPGVIRHLVNWLGMYHAGILRDGFDIGLRLLPLAAATESTSTPICFGKPKATELTRATAGVLRTRCPYRSEIWFNSPDALLKVSTPALRSRIMAARPATISFMDVTVSLMASLAW